MCWGRTKEEALEYVDGEVAQPERDSVRPLEGPGMIQFQATPVDPGSDEADDPEMPLAKLTFMPADERLGPDQPRLDTDDCERITFTLADLKGSVNTA